MTMARVFLPAFSYQEGPLGSRPAASPDNFWLIWYDSATPSLAFSDGSSWIDMGGGGGGGITDITSTDGTINVTNPTGPTTDLSIPVTEFVNHELIGNTTPLSIGPGLGGTFAFDFVLTGSDTLMDLTTPTNPLFLAEGLYSLSAFVSLDDPTEPVDAISMFLADLNVDDFSWGSLSVSVSGFQGITLSAAFGSQAEISMTKWFSAGEGISVAAQNGDSTATIHYDCTLIITQVNT